MSYRLRVSPQAAAQIRAAARWWLKNRTKAPGALSDEIERGFDLARRFPFAGEPVAHPRIPGLRRALLGRVHYYLYYQPDSDLGTVDILALWHVSREGLPAI